MSIKRVVLYCLIMFNIVVGGDSMNNDIKKSDLLSEFQKKILFEKYTEPPFSGEYNDFYKEGIYTCANCGTELYKSTSKFKSGCGWPSFDDEIEGKVKQIPDKDGTRTEIVCNNCKGHLGHVFTGEGFTDKNTRHCVNSLSMNFIQMKNLSKAYFAGGCFWGVEFYLEQLEGVISVESGFMGGHIDNPTYREVTTSKSGHVEVVEVLYNSKTISFETIARKFFEIHDPTQTNGQGNDIGPQYESYIFYSDEVEKKVSEKLISILEKNGYKVATKLEAKSTFWRAEDYHQNYYYQKGGTPYCHRPVNRF